MRVIDLRSDTVTVPTKEMRQAMATAPVGDDVYGEDPTVNGLEEEAARLLGKEKALFVPTGCMGNQLAIMTHCSRGDQVLVDSESHVLHYEMAASAILSGVQLCPVRGLQTDLGWEGFDEYIKPPEDYVSETTLLCLENTNNRLGGTVMDAPLTRKICQKARERGLKIHLDGARIFNAAVYLGCPPSHLAKEVDSVMVCLSKGLGAPVGSLLLGKKDFIRQARINRKILGGGMRQAGVLAAAGRVALSLIHRLEEDHQNARRLAEGLAQIPGIGINLDTVQTNIVLMDVAGTENDAASFLEKMEAKGIRGSNFGGSLVRLVTHKDIVPQEIDKVIQLMGSGLKVE